jgi:hypothetical protein
VRKTFVLIIVGLLTSLPALAWHEVGHKVTAAIAFDQLNQQQQNQVISVLREHPRFEQDFHSKMPDDISNGTEYEQGKWLLERASVWPDLVPRLGDAVRTQYNRSRWHYINMLVWLTDEDQAALEGQLDHNMVTVFTPPLRQNLNIVQALRGNLVVWRDDNATATDKAVALCWILHLAGDLHQPLHTVALFSSQYFPTGDRGGNSIEVRWEGDTKNLHAVWDGLPTIMKSLEPTPRTIRSINEDVVDDAAIDEWLSHHANLARKFVYTDDLKAQLLAEISASKPPTISLSHEYLIAGESIARRQVNLAGHRIAALLVSK